MTTDPHRRETATAEICAAALCRGLRRSYGDVLAVDGVDLHLRVGEIVSLLGPNGAGKSTLIDLIVGLSEPDAGRVEIFGRSPEDAVRRGDIGVMLQTGALLEDATVGEMVGMIASLHDEPLTVQDALERAGIADLSDRRSTRLSGGQRQRVRFAMAIVSDPRLLILDEPTAAMDVGTRRAFWDSMRDFAQTGRTVIFATHYLEEAEAFAHRVVFLRGGRVVADGSVGEVRALVAGRSISSRIGGATADELQALPGASRVEQHGEVSTIISTDSDLTLRALLDRYPQARDVEVMSVGLEEAFLALTADTDTGSGD